MVVSSIILAKPSAMNIVIGSVTSCPLPACTTVRVAVCNIGAGGGAAVKVDLTELEREEETETHDE